MAMNKKSPVAIFMAATAIWAANTIQPDLGNAGARKGGLKEWNTDQPIDADSIPDEDAKKLQKKAKKQNVCIPIGEGENCW